MQVTPQVKLLDYPRDPLAVLYVAYRTCYSNLTPQEIRERIDSGKISRRVMVDFLDKWLPTGHGSPKQQLNFTFGVSGVSRVTSHQFVRHHIGIVHDQQSQRYVEFKENQAPYVVPPSIAGDPTRLMFFLDGINAAFQAYWTLIQGGTPAEDARYVLPDATATNIQFTVNLEELLHIADQRLCTRAQWEFRKFWAMTRREIGKACPELKKFIQPKCGAFRLGYCDEAFAHYQACPLSKVRPHKSQIDGLGKHDGL